MKAMLAHGALILSVCLALLLCTLAYLPNTPSFIALSYALLYGPRWLLLLPALIALCFIGRWSWFGRSATLLCLLLIVRFQDVQLSSPFTQTHAPLRVMSFNLARSVPAPFLQDLIAWQQADVVFLQESGEQLVKAAFNKNWYTHCHFWKCIASRYPLTHTGLLHLKKNAPWGHFAALYEITRGTQRIQLANVHLATPRPVIEHLLASGNTSVDIRAHHQKRSLQAQMLSEWAASHEAVIMGGDFNMSRQDPLYRRFFARYGNAIDKAGQLINYSKFTAYHGVRIDHVLFNHTFAASDARVLENVGSDHRAVYAALNDVQ